MTLTNRGAVLVIALSMLFVFGCLVAGQHMKAERLQAEQGAER